MSNVTAEEMCQAITTECDAIRDFLVEKNKSYGGSVFDPVRIFSKVDIVEQINVRMDDKLSRMARGNDYGEDVEKDLLGYLLLKRAVSKIVEKGKT